MINIYQDRYIYKTKSALINALIDLGISGKTKLKEMPFKQLSAIYHRKRNELDNIKKVKLYEI